MGVRLIYGGGEPGVEALDKGLTGAIDLLALTGTAEEIRQAAAAYRVYPSPVLTGQDSGRAQ